MQSERPPSLQLTDGARSWGRRRIAIPWQLGNNVVASKAPKPNRSQLDPFPRGELLLWCLLLYILVQPVTCLSFYPKAC